MEERTLIAKGKHIEFWRVGDHWEYAHRSDARQGVTIVAVTNEDKIVLVEQYRAPLGQHAIELPAGLVEGSGDDGEAVTAAVKRELEEETGYTCERVEVVATGSSSPGITDELNSLCLARGLRRTDEGIERVDVGYGVTKQARPRGLKEEGEKITVYEAPVQAAREWLAQREREGVVVDLKVFAGLYFAAAARRT